MTDKKTLKKKIEQHLKKSKEAFPFFKYGNRVFFFNSNNILVSLDSDYFFERLSSLREHFKNREQKEKDRLIRENLSIFAVHFDLEEVTFKAEKVYESCFCEVWKFSNYPESWDFKDVEPKTLRSLRGEQLDNNKLENNNAWNSAYERTRWLTEFAIKVRNKLRKELVGD
jgi:hypothetical protein